ncbi:toxin CSTX-20-like [Centruroides vittatus]|uniref:toxin CSTX-20-like n=1 Tax=Centruroides vittatus TaxID=120091 RepID=UPI003510C612
MLKYLIFAFGLFITAQALTCSSQESCYENECCIHVLFGSGVCRRKPKIDNLCSPLARVYNADKQTFKIGCICPEGYECLLGESLLDRVYKCRKSKEVTTESLETTVEGIELPDLN